MLIVDTNYIHEKRTIHHVMNILSMTNIQKEFVQIIYTHISCRSYALNQPHTSRNSFSSLILPTPHLLIY